LSLISFAVVVVVSGVIVWKKGFLEMDGLRGAVQN